MPALRQHVGLQPQATREIDRIVVGFGFGRRLRHARKPARQRLLLAETVHRRPAARAQARHQREHRCAILMGLQLRGPGVFGAVQLPDFVLPVARGAQQHLGRARHRPLAVHHAAVLLPHGGGHGVDEELAARRLDIGRDDAGQADLFLAHTRRHARRQRAQIGQQRLHRGVVDLEARHQRIERAAADVHAGADRRGHAVFVIRCVMLVEGLDAADVLLDHRPAVLAEQITPGDRADRDVALDRAEPAAAVAVEAGHRRTACLQAAASHGHQRLAVDTDAFAVDAPAQRDQRGLIGILGARRHDRLSGLSGRDGPVLRPGHRRHPDPAQQADRRADQQLLHERLMSTSSTWNTSVSLGPMVPGTPRSP